MGNFVLPGRVYDLVKLIALVLLPAAGSLYFGLAAIWGLPAGEQVVGTITLVDTFLGLVINKTGKNYQDAQPTTEVKGDLILEQYPNGEVAGIKMEGTEVNPIFTEGTYASYAVKRRTVPEMDPAQE